MKKKSRKKGFTLVEVLVVLAIVAMLAATAIPKVKEIYEEAQFDKAKSDAMQIVAAIQRVELKNELSGTAETQFTDMQILGKTDYDKLKVDVKSGNYIFRFSSTGLLPNHTSCNVIQFYPQDSDTSDLLKVQFFSEVIIP